MFNKQQRKSETCFTKLLEISYENVILQMEIAFCLDLKTLFRKVISRHFTQLLQKDFSFSNRQYCSHHYFVSPYLNILKSYKKLLVVCDIQFYKLLYEKKSVMNYYAHLHCDNYFNFCVHLRILLLNGL